MIVKALSLWEPWASLMRCGAKTIETRGWGTSYRGPLLICGAKRWTREQDDFLHTPEVQKALGGKWHSDMLLGQAACLVDLVDCVRAQSVAYPAPEGARVYLERHFGDFSTGRFAWFTENLHAFDPFPVVGRQNLFNVELPAEVACLLEPSG
jgi:hypothetical protein